MDLQSCVVKGGVLILHRLQEGKHQYQVENVKYKKASDKAFVRGDKLMQINGVDLQELSPEELAQRLAADSPMLTVHKAIRVEQPGEQVFPAEDALLPFFKESTVLSFRMEMRRQEELQGEATPEERETDSEEDPCQGGRGEEEEREDLLVISMKKTSISVVSGRGCDRTSPCQGCNGTGCVFNDVVLVSDSSEVVLVPRGGGSFSQLKSLNSSISHYSSHYYLRSLCSQKTLYASPNPEEMTIYYYKSTSFSSFRGQPVVLNFSKSSCFLRCCKEEDRVFLQVETCEKQRLKKISKNDEGGLSFVFYMKSGGTEQRTFESALHGGWFIQIDAANLVTMVKVDGGPGDESFLFVIQT
ncbi:uncharacterized protein [Clinocottus analis]|uniref:uncharacterized protein n=1 Tax=Clinocottus analis TaxID=304258 RepID=UPI0035C1B71C